MLARLRNWFAQASDQTVIRIVATTVGLLAYIVWGTFTHFHSGSTAPADCQDNCSTEFSSRHRGQ